MVMSTSKVSIKRWVEGLTEQGKNGDGLALCGGYGESHGGR